ncbi:MULTISPECIES: RidA family protein [Mameliella]|uniref:RidA family protein n=1 Tax=Mameliella TaxID=1434019 RepID=UPI00087F90BF|nr:MULTISPECIES: RidA family protein [Mameliella]MCR9272095.1 RidA family protein [Paracoccaceae bacterium]MBY6119784.1 RidA family protein [Mameliella alba]OWV45486.1 RidA family protein [Mameliella alba]OWV50019.1 RidA family protein [Mameliella alba]OWV62708.1 RidA family protein [Mameliella alba]
MPIDSLIPDTIAAPFARYAHGVATDSLVLTSGQLPLALNGSVPEGPEAQAALCFANIDAILAAGGTSKHHALRINAYVTHRDHMQGYMAARDAWLADARVLPASTLMIVSGFTRPEFLVEVEVTALRP